MHIKKTFICREGVPSVNSMRLKNDNIFTRSFNSFAKRNYKKNFSRLLQNNNIRDFCLTLFSET